ncbi:putative glycolipid-binding domain-containing protein [Gordonia sp. LSe1-13]|uniref:Glycolipid-binding domain-containing protein n=1 Tax=Gordonia sesuvii TaxID=3116777 RepID=A0ABU7MGD0_9ACTN|nr:putative glycolipid-binding domain-containing protein [Gordonia sp. LSe1-13]
MSSSQTAPENTAGAGGSSSAPDVKTIVTWRGERSDRLEQVRLHVNGARLKAYGRIIAAATDTHEAFSASYELVTNDIGVTKRLSIHLLRASGETQLAITRDGEHNWLVQSADGTVRGDFNGAADVDLALSPMFNALPIRRLQMHRGGDEVDIPVVYLYLPDGRVEPATLHYTPTEAGVDVVSPVATSSLTVDENGFVIDYAGLATRV